jgi:ribonucleoside-diphosphate reductase alpha chain
MSETIGLQEIFEQPFYPLDKHLDVELSEAALTVMEKKYLRGESPTKMFIRVAAAVAKPLQDQMAPEDFEKIRYAFFNIMATRDFMPNSPTLMNAGRSFNQLAACFVVPVEDSMEGIFRDAIADMALIQRTGGGTGFDFSRLRPKGATVSSTQGESSGPIPFMRAFNACTDTVKQGGARRGANMGILRVDHPDIREFITLKSNQDEMTNFNLSVAVTDVFMKAVDAGTTYDLVHNGKVYGQEDARAIWNLIGERAWASGEPGVIFIDTINKKNTLPGLGPIEATNPCGEQPLLPHEACNLGSINLRNLVENGEFNYNKLRALTALAVTFLDCVIDAGKYPLPQITKMAKANRKIGLGVMGFADVCYMLEIGYDTSRAVQLAEQIMSCISSASKETSQKLAEIFEPFPNIDMSIYKNKMRNAAITTIAPTGTISLIAGASYGIEPFFALSYTKKLADTGEILHFVNEHVEAYMVKHKFDDMLQDVVKAYIFKNGTIKGVYKAALSMAKANQSALMAMEDIFITAQDIAPGDHVHIQAAFQKYTDNAVSKTINFSNGVSVESIQNIFKLAYRSGCKGITVYRDGCRDSQPLKVEKSSDAETQTIKLTNGLKRPQSLTGITKQIPTGCGMMLVTVNMDENNNVFEVLMRAGANGGCSAYTDAVARLLSISLRHGMPLEVLIDQLRSVRCDNFRYQAGKDSSLKGKSCPDVVGRFLQEIVDKKKQTPDEAIKAEMPISPEQLNSILQQAMLNTTGAEGAKCPECGKLLLRAEGCLVCQCGYSRC